jgi:hypothetical protein
MFTFEILENPSGGRHLYLAQIDTKLAQSLKENLVLDSSWIQEEPLWRGEEKLQRYHLTNSNSPVLKTCSDYLISNDFKETLLDVAFDNQKFLYQWCHPDRKKFSQVVRTYAKFVKDLPNYYTDLHCDSKHQILFGMIYFIDGNDPKQTTIFYTDNNKNNPYPVPTGMGCGWLLLNHNNAWHEGGNQSNQDRYCLQFGLNFDF